MKTYTFIYEDKDNNELQRKEVQALNMRDAKKMAKRAWARSMMNDLHEIKVI